jgi:hypothetical protein
MHFNSTLHSDSTTAALAGCCCVVQACQQGAGAAEPSQPVPHLSMPAYLLTQLSIPTPLLLRLLFAAAACCRHASKELVQLSLVSLCLISAWLCGQLGLSEELGAFIAGKLGMMRSGC